MLFISIQPFDNEEYYTQEFIKSMALAAKLGGARGLRIEGVRNINFINEYIDLPIIGLIKEKIKTRKRYICPTLDIIKDVLSTNCDFIAIDYTLRDGLDSKYYLEITNFIRKNSKSKIVADIATLEEAKYASEVGVDYISSSMRGFTDDTKEVKIPDLNFIKKLKRSGISAIIAEGGYSNHKEYKDALNNGAEIVVIGTAITRPHILIDKIIKGD